LSDVRQRKIIESGALELNVTLWPNLWAANRGIFN
jgi:hypothetical protein